MNWKGEILLESLKNPSVLDALHVESAQEIEDEDGLWHVYTVSLKEDQIATLGAFLKDGPWFMHFVNEEKTAVVFKDACFVVLDNDQESIKKIKEHARSLCIPEEELRLTVS